MVNNMKSVMMTGAPCWLRPCGGRSSRRETRQADVRCSPDKEVIYVPPTSPKPLPGGALRRRPHSAASANAAATATAAAAAAAAAAAVRRIQEAEYEKPDDVIDLGAPPRRLFRRASEGQPNQPRRRRGLTPNPRLYPGPKPEPKPRPRRAEPKRARRGKRKLRPVPNSRLYRPGPPRLKPHSPPPARPCTSWSPPPPASASLETASNVVLRQLRNPPEKPSSPGCAPSLRSHSPHLTSPERHNQHALVVTLPSAHTPRYQPASEHFRARQSILTRPHSPPPAAFPRPRLANMDAAAAEDRSDGNETLSAPSEFLAEFLSAIMRRQYAEALKYCRLILQYEPHNATAQSFYPLLRQKLRAASRTHSRVPSPSPAHSASPVAPARSPPPTLNSDEEPPPPAAPPDNMERCSSSEDDDQSDLELDSSHDSTPSLSFSHHTNRTESTSGSAPGCSGGWESSGSGAERSASAPPDDNGNPPPPPPPPARLKLSADPRLTADDLENDNASAGGEPHQNLKNDSVSSLRRLRAQFACSIK